MPRTVKKPDIRKQEIIMAAMGLFLEKTYDATTTQDVMKALGIAKGTIYHYFASKSELLDAVVVTMSQDYLNRRLPEVKACRGNALKKIACLTSREHLSEEEETATEQLHAQGNVTLHIRLLAALVEQISPVLSTLIQEGCEEGILKTDHPLECAELLLSGIQFLTDKGVHPWPKEDLQRRINAFPEIADHLLGAKPGSFAFLG